MIRENTTGKVLKLFITKENHAKTRESVQKITVDDKGVRNDKFYAKDPHRAILITCISSYELSAENDIDISYGSLGENILIDVSPYSLVTGDRLNIGNIVLEITQNCTLCNGLSTLNSKLPKLLKNDRGIFAKVISNSWEINVNDKVEILTH